ncbi:DUF4352 domain-containing protein [Candidatus Bathyarchaeota archaeon]|nr:DUF4352 domain-containing protein [Candidatus Bathyarchaeota archaeon]
MLKSRKAVSPVIATIIIVAIAISIAIAVAYWMVGITGAFTRFEKLEIISAYAELNKTSKGYNVTMRVKNSGTVDVTIDLIFINGKPFDAVGATVWNGTTTFDAPEELQKNLTVKTGESRQFIVVLPAAAFNPGQSVEITIHTAGGKEYPKNVVLP